MTLQHINVNRILQNTKTVDSAHQGTIPSGTSLLTALSDGNGSTTFWEIANSQGESGEIDLGYGGFSLPSGALLRVAYVWFYVSQADWLANPSSAGAVQFLGFKKWGSGAIFPKQIIVIPSAPKGETGWIQLQMNLPQNGINTASDVNNSLAAVIGPVEGDNFSAQFAIAEVTGDILYAVVPTVSSITPSGTVTNTLRPTIGWAFNGDGLGQSIFRAMVYSQAQYSAAGFTPFVTPGVWDSAGVASSAQQAQVPNNLAPGTYRAYVSAAQTVPESNTVQWATSNAFSAFTIAPASPAIPTAVIPANGSTISTDVPLLQATLPVPAVVGTSLKIEWQIAQNNSFTSNPRVVTLDSFTSIAGTYSQAVSPAVQLNQGTWWIRARSLDSLGTYSSYTGPQSFTVSHVPATAGWSPTGQVSIPYASAGINLSWQFQDPSPVDSQSAYQVIVERDSDNSVIVDSGKVTSGTNVYTAAIPVNRKDVLLHWRVRVWDSDDVAGSYSSNQQFYTRDAPVITITQPGTVGSSYSGAYGGTYDAQVGSTGILTPTYPVVWAVTATSGRTQVAYRVEVFSGESTLAPLVFDTGMNFSPAQSFDFTGTTHRFKLNQTYTIRITVQDTSGMQNAQSVTAVAIWAPPPTPTFVANGTLAESNGAVTIDWSTIADPTFDSWRVYRRVVGDQDWTLVDTLSNPNTQTYFDYMAPANVGLQYVVVQAANRFGDIIESEFPIEQTVTAFIESYFFIVPGDNSNNVKLYHVTADSFTEPYEEAEMVLLNIGRQKEYGTRLGYTGTLTATLRDTYDGVPARTQRIRVQNLRRLQQDIFMKNPFGDVFLVALGEIGYERMPGVGTRDFGTITVPYEEVVSD